MTDIAILLPVLDRPQNAAPVVESIRGRSWSDPRIVFLVSPRDTRERAAAIATGAEVRVVDWEPGPGDYARKINHGFHFTSEEFVFLGADDLDFHEGWDVEAMDVADQTGAAVIGTQDLCNPLTKRGKHSTHSLVRRSYIELFGGTFDEEPGVVYAECYDHQWVDNELCIVAQDRGHWAFAQKAIVEHMHPLDRSRRIALDATYRKALAQGVNDQRLFVARRRDWVKERRRHRARA